MPIQKSNFKPAWWLTNPHLQTMAAKWFRRNNELSTVTEMLELPDGDFIDLSWTELPARENSQPIVVILHGLAGSVNSHYAKGMLNTIKQRGWIGVLMHFRSCSGRPNRQARSYHSGDTQDITYLSNLLNTRYQHCPFGIMGFSLGGNVLACYLAQQPNNCYSAATIICAPLHLQSCSKRINKGLSKIYQKYLIDMLKASTQEKIELNLLKNISAKKLHSINTMWDFDEHVTAPVNGFNGAEDYYHQASGRDVLHQINIPCLIIHANDDPFLCDISTTFVPDLPANVCLEISRTGGHVGFVASNKWFKPRYWLEHRIPIFLSDYL